MWPGSRGLASGYRQRGLGEQKAQNDGADTEDRTAVPQPVAGHMDHVLREPCRNIRLCEPDGRAGGVCEVWDCTEEAEQDRRTDQAEVRVQSAARLCQV